MAASRLLASIQQDLVYGARALAKSPGFTLVAALSLALGIGANTAIFSLISSLMLRPLPVADPHALVAVGNPSRVGGLSQGSVRSDLFSYPMYRELRDQAKSVSSLFASGRSGRLVAEAPGLGSGAFNPRGRLVSGNYFSVLGVEARMGRTFGPDDEKTPGGSPYVVLSHSCWQRRFAGDPNILGRKLTLNGASFTVVGVAREGFTGEIVGTPTEIWIPLSMQAEVQRGRPSLENWEINWLLLMGRLAPGSTLESARTELDGLYHRTVKSLVQRTGNPDLVGSGSALPVPVSSGATGFSWVRAAFSTSLLTLMAMVGVVLLVACANVANLLLERATGRRKEVGVRLALGASRQRLVAQLLTESLLLCVLGAVLGLFFASWAAAALIQVAGGGSTIALDASADGRVLAFTAGLAFATAALFGLAPALSATRVRVGQVLRESGRGTVEGRHRGGKLLVVGQFALSLLLLVAAGLFVRTLRNLEQVELGYPADRLLIVALDPQAAGLESQDAQPFLDDLFERLGSLPGAAGATASINGLFSGTESSTTVEFEGYKPAQEKETEVLYDEVGPKYFQTVGLPLLAGRDITAADRRPAGRVAVINQALARTYFPGANPVGQHLTVTGAHPITYEIVGVAADARDHKLRGPVEPRFYYPMLADEGFPGALYFEVASAHPAALVQPVRQALKDYRATVPVDSVTTLEENLAEEVNEERMIARLSAAFGVLALVLAGVGLYGVISYSVARRTQELGLRQALGAAPSAILWLVLRETLILAVAGVALGVPAALAGGRLIASRLVGLSVGDPLTLVLATLMLLLVALAAGTLPGARATRVDPVRALQGD